MTKEENKNKEPTKESKEKKSTEIDSQQNNNKPLNTGTSQKGQDNTKNTTSQKNTNENQDVKLLTSSKVEIKIDTVEKHKPQKKDSSNNSDNKKSPSKSDKQNVKSKSFVPAIVIIVLILFLIIGSIIQQVVTVVNGSSDKENNESNAQSQQTQNVQENTTDTNSNGNVMGTNDSEIIKDPIPNFKPISQPPEVSAKAYSIVNLNDNTEIYSKNPNLPLPPASVTKIMTAIIALEEYQLGKEIVIPEYCTRYNASKVGFKAYDVITIQDALYGLLVQSGADAACAIANVESNEKAFIDKMNRKANELGLQNTSFENEIGLDSISNQYSSVNDIIKLSEYALKYDTFRKIVGTKEVNISPLNNPSTIYRLRNTNELLFTLPGSIGIKTGTTPEAGECLSYLYENPIDDQRILIVILGSNDRFGDTKTLLEWVKNEAVAQSQE